MLRPRASADISGNAQNLIHVLQNNYYVTVLIYTQYHNVRIIAVICWVISTNCQFNINYVICDRA